MFAENSFKDKNVMVTGAGRGIGRAITLKLVELGATVYAVSKNPDNLKTLVDPKPKNGGKIIPVCVNLTDWTGTREAIEKVPLLDALVNNAGICKAASFMNATKEDFESMYQINLISVVNVSQVVAKKMIESGRGGSIINISSISALKMMTQTAAYGASKAALVHLTRTMAMELGPHKIRVNAVNPGCVLTDLLIQVDRDIKSTHSEEDHVKHVEDYKSQLPMQKLLIDMDAVVNTVLFHVSGLATDVTGTVIPVDGGFCAM